MRLPCILKAPDVKSADGTCDGLITWADITPTLLDYAGATADPAAFHGRSFRPIINAREPANWRDEIYASHTFHEITNYYPMRVIRTKRFKFIWNIAWKLDYSFASDLWESASWQASLRSGSERFGARRKEAYLHRPRFELYDLESDPDELVNLADRPDQADRVSDFTDKLKRFQRDTRDPWLHKWVYE